MQGKSSCYQEGKRKEEGREASRAGGMTVSYIAHCELAINPGLQELLKWRNSYLLTLRSNLQSPSVSGMIYVVQTHQD